MTMIFSLHISSSWVLLRFHTKYHHLTMFRTAFKVTDARLKLHHPGDPNCSLHKSSSWVKIRLHTENHLPRLPVCALKVPGGGVGWVASYPVSSQAPTHVEVELGCDN